MGCGVIMMAVHNEKIMSLILVMHCCHPFNLLSHDSSSVFFMSLACSLCSHAIYLYVPFHYITKPSLWSSSFPPTWRLNPLSFNAIIPPLHMSAPSQLSTQSLFLYISNPLDLTCLSDSLIPLAVPHGESQ